MKLKLKDIALAGIPIAGMFIVPRVLKVGGLAITGLAAGGRKKRGIDYLEARATISNTGDVEFTDIKVSFMATSSDRTYFCKIGDYPIASLSPGQTITTDWVRTTLPIPSDFPLGNADLRVRVSDRDYPATGELYAEVYYYDLYGQWAWEVVEPVKKIEITTIEVG